MIQSYADLSSAVTRRLVGHQIDNADMAEFISLAEFSINRTLRVQQMIRRRVATPSGSYLALPGDYLEAVNLTLLSKPTVQLQWMSMSGADAARNRFGPPRFYVVSGMEMEIVPAPDDGTPEIELVYYGRVPPLTADTNSSNWLIREAPDLYLAATLAHAHQYVKEPDAALTQAQASAAIIATMNQAAKRSRVTTPLISRPQRKF